MGKPEKSGKDEMNLAVLPIALLGRNDMRFDLANKLGLAQYQYASHLKRPLSAAADELA